jgi:hypothetical protein
MWLQMLWKTMKFAIKLLIKFVPYLKSYTICHLFGFMT